MVKAVLGLRVQDQPLRKKVLTTLRIGVNGSGRLFSVDPFAARSAKFKDVHLATGFLRTARFQACITIPGFLQDAARCFIPGKNTGMQFVHREIEEDMAREGRKRLAENSPIPEQFTKPKTDLRRLRRTLVDTDINSAGCFTFDLYGEVGAGLKSF
jgi:hypothetical protein